MNNAAVHVSFKKICDSIKNARLHFAIIADLQCTDKTDVLSIVLISVQANRATETKYTMQHVHVSFEKVCNK